MTALDVLVDDLRADLGGVSPYTAAITIIPKEQQ